MKDIKNKKNKNKNSTVVDSKPIVLIIPKLPLIVLSLLPFLSPPNQISPSCHAPSSSYPKTHLLPHNHLPTPPLTSPPVYPHTTTHCNYSPQESRTYPCRAFYHNASCPGSIRQMGRSFCLSREECRTFIELIGGVELFALTLSLLFQQLIIVL